MYSCTFYLLVSLNCNRWRQKMVIEVPGVTLLPSLFSKSSVPGMVAETSAVFCHSWIGTWVGKFQKGEVSAELEISWRNKAFRYGNSKHSQSQPFQTSWNFIITKGWDKILNPYKYLWATGKNIVVSSVFGNSRFLNDSWRM